MPDPADDGNRKSFVILEDQLDRQSSVRFAYIITYCSGDGDELKTVDFSGTSLERKAHMQEELGIDPATSSNWAFAQWSDKERLWIIAAGNGDMKQLLKQHISDPKNFKGLRQRYR